ncbi:MAG: CoA transferase subunit A [Rhizobiales bacterium]|nr:CoA transferase subunit A [Hyphomicrobiales bacterium]
MAAREKLTSLGEAISANVHQGDTVFVAGFGHLVPFAAAHEILRQRIGGLTLARSGADILFDQMIAAGAVSKVTFGYLGNPGIGLGHAFRRAAKEGSIEIDEWTNFSIMLRLHAARMGLPFMPSRIMQIGDQPSGGKDLKTVTCPYTGDELAAIPALVPDVALVHAQQADAAGNVQIWGVDGDTVEGALASDRIVVTVERIVGRDEITAAPERTRIPADRVSALAEVPWGAHPSYAAGYYTRDDQHFFDFDKVSRDPDELSAYLDRWVYGATTRQDYLELIGEKTRAALEAGLQGRAGS